MSLLAKYTTRAERGRGCSWADRFESESLVAQNGGSVTGAPTFSPDGVVLNGTTDHLTYNLCGTEFNSSTISIVVEFTPDFATDYNARILFFDSTSGSRYFVVKRNNTNSNVLRIWLGNTAIAAIPEATYSAYWLQGQRNIIVVSGTSGNTSAWLNGHKILNASATAWTAKAPSNLYIGSNYAGSYKFDGTIHKLQVFKTQLTDQECLDISNGAVYDIHKSLILDYHMRQQDHDISNVRTLDAGPNARHAQLGNGSTPTTYPTKLSYRHGYDFDGGDYLKVDSSDIMNTDKISFVVEFMPDFETDYNANLCFFASTNGSRYLALKYNNAANNVLEVVIGNTVIADIPEATYSPVWLANRRNVLIISSDSVTDLTNAWLNGYQILVNDTSAWAPANPDDLWIGSTYVPDSYFDGKIHTFQVYNIALTPMQVNDITARLARKWNEV